MVRAGGRRGSRVPETGAAAIGLLVQRDAVVQDPPGGPQRAGNHQGHQHPADPGENAHPHDRGRLFRNSGASRIMKEFYAILTLAYRDLMKFLRDPARLVSTFALPLLLILGGGMQMNLGQQIGFGFLPFTFTGVLAQTLFQSSAMGLISLIEDREHDFSQEIFVSPISRYSIILGKIVGETLVALTQGFGIIALGMLAGISFTWY